MHSLMGMCGGGVGWGAFIKNHTNDSLDCGMHFYRTMWAQGQGLGS